MKKIKVTENQSPQRFLHQVRDSSAPAFLLSAVTAVNRRNRVNNFLSATHASLGWQLVELWGQNPSTAIKNCGTKSYDIIDKKSRIIDCIE
jgi:hypothetical protein